jgi:hypothetical protein
MAMTLVPDDDAAAGQLNVRPLPKPLPVAL